MDSNSGWLSFVDQAMSIIEKFVAVALMIFAASEFHKYRKQQCSEAAAKFLGLFKGTVEDIIKIVDCAENMQYSHIQDDLMINLEIKESKVDSAKPSRMIANKIKFLEEESHFLCAQISGKEAIKLKKLIDKLKIFCLSLQGAVHAKLERNIDHLNAPNNKQVLNEYRQYLSSIIEDAKKILVPVIEGKWIMTTFLKKLLKE